ncbi:MAG TPA: family 20 glycosylhydrolase [Steroidobacteraceae bacterium]|nr:family 20 glycosylhydrolase [Steroidobacteraceae bacterium]
MKQRTPAIAWVCLWLAGWLLLGAAPAFAKTAIAVIPVPAQVETLAGSFVVTADTGVAASGGPEAELAARYFVGLLKRGGGFPLAVAVGGEAPRSPRIAFVQDDAAHADPEGYELTVRADGVRIAARGRGGLVYGAVTLWQLLTSAPGPQARIALPALRIVDQPRFRWRGVMLDSARHYQSPEFIERFIDAMAIHKLNVLHWHLTDDQGWRLEIKKYPRLTDFGAWRVPAGRAAASDIDRATGKPRLYGGYYSQDTVRRIVAYASARGVTIVPEIEMPGHATASIAAYPALGVTSTPPAAVPADWGVYPHLYNAEESTFRFLEDVLDEVIALFPGGYVHVGGDEAVKQQWQASPRVQARMPELGVADEAGLQSYFIHRMEKYLRARGRRLVGWDEILDGGIAPGAIVMSWRGLEGALTAARNGHDTILSPWPTLYLDNRQGDSPSDPPGRERIITAEEIYRFNPLPPELAAGRRHHVLGLQANAWTEHMRTEERVEFMTFPRVAALAEVAWSPAGRLDWPDFVERLAPEMDRYRALGIRAAGTVFDVRIDAAERSAGGPAAIRLANQAGFGEIRYTLDGSEPRASSRRYRAEFNAVARGKLRAATFEGRRRISAIAERPLDAVSLARRSSRELALCDRRLAIALEDDAPVAGPRAVFMIDIMNPCWIYRGADLTRGATLTAAVGQLPFNFQIGDDANKIVFRQPRSAAGELEVRVGGCDGEPAAVLPLAPAADRDAVTRLPAARIDPRAGRHDLCFTFTQNGVDPLWAIDWVGLDR